MRARYSPSDQRQVGSTGVASRTGLGTEPGSMGGRRSIKRAYITTKHYLKEGKHHVCCWSGKQTIWFNLWGEYSHDRLLSKEKTKSYHPPPPSILPLKGGLRAGSLVSSKTNLAAEPTEREKNGLLAGGSPAKIFLQLGQVRLAPKQKVPPTFLMNSTTSSFVYP